MYRQNAKEDDVDKTENPMSEQAFNLKLTKYFASATIVVIAMMLGTCAYVNGHSDNAKVRQSELGMQAAHELAVKAMFEHK